MRRVSSGGGFVTLEKRTWRLTLNQRNFDTRLKGKSAELKRIHDAWTGVFSAEARTGVAPNK